MKKTVSEYVK